MPQVSKKTQRVPWGRKPRRDSQGDLRISRIALGIALLIAGLAGLVLPVLQGVVLIVAALAILRKDIPFVATIWDRFVVPMQQRYRHWRDARRCR